jgi:hypothetical protein
MAKLIKQAENKAVKFTIGDKVFFNSWYHDGRTSHSGKVYATVTKVNRVTVDVRAKSGETWRVMADELTDLKTFLETVY